MKSIGGRPRKHTPEQQKTHARCYLDIKNREPKVTQEQYARNYGLSGRTLRRYIERYYPLEAIELKEEELMQKKAEIAEKINIADNLDDDEPRGGLMIAWV